MNRYRVEGLSDLIKDINQLDKMPQQQISKGARKGAKVLLMEARSQAKKRKLSGKMWKKLTLKAYRTRVKGKKVYRVSYPKTEKFPEAVKVTKGGKQYYYPASQNYGFKTKDGGHVEGLHFLEGAMQAKGNLAAKVIVEEIGKEIKKMLSEGGR